MNRPITVAALVAMLALAGCGGQKPSGETATSSTPAADRSTAAPKDAAIPDIAALDRGPRAGEAPADHESAERGEKVFQNKGCSACHAFGVKKSGPDLAGVSMRRTAAWMESQILHPEIMVKEDPTARQLFAQYMLQMPNQGLTPEQAKDVIEYLKHTDSKSSSEKKEESR